MFLVVALVLAGHVYGLSWNEPLDNLQGVIHPSFFENLCKAEHYSHVQFLIENDGFSKHLDGKITVYCTLFMRQRTLQF